MQLHCTLHLAAFGDDLLDVVPGLWELFTVLVYTVDTISRAPHLPHFSSSFICFAVNQPQPDLFSVSLGFV